MEKIIGIAIIVVLLLLIFIAIPAQQKSDEDDIRIWAVEKNQVILKIERCYWDIGPFWFRNKHDRIYKVDLVSGKTFWFRMSVFKTDIEAATSENE